MPERDQAYCVVFSRAPGSGKFNFLSEILGFKSLPLSSQLVLKMEAPDESKHQNCF